MRLIARRRNVVVWSSSAGPTGRTGAQAFVRQRRTGRFRRLIRTGALLTVIGLRRLACAVRGTRVQIVLAGVALTTAGVILRGNPWGGGILLPGLMLLAGSLLTLDCPDEDHRRLAHELAAYSTHAQRCDLEATLDRYPDTVTHELREILSGQAAAAGSARIPGTRTRPV